MSKKTKNIEKLKDLALKAGGDNISLSSAAKLLKDTAKIRSEIETMFFKQDGSIKIVKSAGSGKYKAIDFTEDF